MFDIGYGEGGEIRMCGRFDAAQSDRVEAFLAEVEASTVVDCGELAYVSSAGLGILFVTQKRLVDAGESLKLINLSAHLREVFEIAGFDTIFQIE